MYCRAERPVGTTRRAFAAVAACLAGFLFAPLAQADWYYFVMKVECQNDALRIIDYSAWNEEGQEHGSEPGAIDVDKLSTWRRTENDLNVPDKPLPHVTDCAISSGKYRVILTNAGGGYSAPHPVINVLEVSVPDQPRILIRDLNLEDSSDYQRYEILFSSAYPRGRIIAEKGSR